MAKQTSDPDAAQYIAPLNMNGLQGRMLRLPAAKPDITRELHAARHGQRLDDIFFEPPQWTGALPTYHDAIAPAADETAAAPE